MDGQSPSLLRRRTVLAEFNYHIVVEVRDVQEDAVLATNLTGLQNPQFGTVVVPGRTMVFDLGTPYAGVPGAHYKLSKRTNQYLNKKRQQQTKTHSVNNTVEASTTRFQTLAGKASRRLFGGL